MIAGPLDYTPGSMRNRTKRSSLLIRGYHPQGTRCHELAMYVVLDQPFAMLVMRRRNTESILIL